jgi:hypothetical protein
MKINVRLTHEGKAALRQSKELLRKMFGDMPFKSNSVIVEYCLHYFLDNVEKNLGDSIGEPSETKEKTINE